MQLIIHGLILIFIWLSQLYIKHFVSKVYIITIIVHMLLRKTKKKQGKSEGFDSCDRPSNLTIGFKS